MKTLKTLKIALTLTAFLASSMAYAGNCDGGSCTGGGNVLKDFLISDYAVKSTSELPHFSAVEQYLKMMEDRVPEFGEKLRGFTQRKADDPNGVQWYLIPSEIKELPHSVTHLNFPTDQSMYQVNNEVFVSEPDTSARKPDLMGRVYLQDLLELAHPTKDPESVRKMLVYLRTNNYAPPQATLRNMLQQLGFGKFETADELAEKKNKVNAYVEKMVKDTVRVLLTNCRGWDPTLYLDRGVFLRGNYLAGLGVDPGSEKRGGLDSKLASLLRDAMLAKRNELWKNEHFASLHAALGLSTVKLNPGKVLGPNMGNEYSSDDYEMAYWYSGYLNRLGILGDASKVPSEVSQENQARIAKYEEKYKNLWFWQRNKQVCADVEAINKDLRGGASQYDDTPAAANEKAPAGETDAK